MRADARANRQAVVDAARQVFAEEGASVAMERVATRAGVGIATLYRRFPERQDLVKAVLLDMFGSLAAAAEEAEERAGGDPARAWELLVRTLADLRFGLLMPTLSAHALPLMETDTELARAAERAFTTAQQLFGRAQEAGHLRPDISILELQMLFSTVTRPAPGMPRELSERLAERFIEIVVNGLRARPDDVPLPGEAIHRADLLAALASERAD